MKDERLLEALRAGTKDVLEKMFFVRALPEPGAEPGTPRIAAMLTFTGNSPGWLRLKMSEPAARVIAADFLAEEPATLSRAQVGEVICELANMLCGSALSRREPQGSFHLSAPQLVAPESSGDQGSAVIHTVEIGHGALTVAMGWGVPQCQKAERVY